MLTMIGVDSQAAILVTSSFCPALGHYLVDIFHNLMEQTVKKMKKTMRGQDKPVIEVRWVPGHRGIPGNEAADAEAKKAARGSLSKVSRIPAVLRRQGKVVLRQVFNHELESNPIN